MKKALTILSIILFIVIITYDTARSFQASSGGTASGVSSFNARTGDVTPTGGDYDGLYSAPDHTHNEVYSGGTGTAIFNVDLSALSSGGTITVKPSVSTSATYTLSNTAGITFPVSIQTVTAEVQIPYAMRITRSDLLCRATSTASVAFSYAAVATSPTWTAISASEPVLVSNTIGTTTNTTLTGWTKDIPAWSFIRAVASSMTGTCRATLGGTGY